MTNITLFIPFIIFCIVMTSTPGPNNAFVMISGARFGIWKTIPLILGISIGVGLQLLALGIGINQIFNFIPELHLILSIIGSLYIVWLAWKIASSGTLEINQDRKPSMGFIEGAIFQWINPKAWIISISTVTTYFSMESNFLEIFFAALVLIFITIPCVGIWAVAGTFLRKLLMNIRYARIFNLSMSIALLMAVLPTTIKLIITNVMAIS